MRLEDVFKNVKPLPPPSSATGFFGFRDTNGNGTPKKTKKSPPKKARTVEDSDDESDKDGLLNVGGHNLRSRSLGEGEEKDLQEGIRKMKV